MSVYFRWNRRPDSRNEKAAVAAPASVSIPQQTLDGLRLVELTADITLPRPAVKPFKIQMKDLCHDGERNLSPHFHDAIDVWLRHWAGEYQHHIAASYGVSPGRINEILKGHRHPGSEQEARLTRGVV